MAELHVILLRVLVWSVRCMMLRQDIERCLSPCHPLGEKDLPYIPVYNAMFFLSYSCHKKAPRIIHRCRV